MVERLFTAPRIERLAHTVHVETLGANREIVIAGSQFGHPLTNEDLISGLLPEEKEHGQAMIDKSGICERVLVFGRTRPEVLAEAVTASRLVLKKAMEVKGWDNLDALYLSSLDLPVSAAHLVAEEAGVSPDHIQNYRLACAGSAAAFVDALYDYGNHSARVAIVAAEPLSAIIDLTTQGTTKDNRFNIPVFFGDGYYVLLFDPSDFQLQAAQTHFIPGGGMQVITDYDFDELKTTHDPTLLRPYHAFSNDAEGIVVVNENGLYILQVPPPPESGLQSDMDGGQTAIFFMRHTPGIVGRLPANILQNVNQAWWHQPGSIVLQGIERGVNRLLNGHSVSMPFLDLGAPNMSSATFLAVGQKLIQTGRLTPNQNVLLVAPGIGSTHVAAVINLAFS